jgi:chromosome segregation ATPase
VCVSNNKIKTEKLELETKKSRMVVVVNSSIATVCVVVHWLQFCCIVCIAMTGMMCVPHVNMMSFFVVCGPTLPFISLMASTSSQNVQPNGGKLNGSIAGGTSLSDNKQFDIQAKKLFVLESDLRDAQGQCCRSELDKADLRKQLHVYTTALSKRQAASSRLREELDAEKRRADAATAKLHDQKVVSDAVIAKWQESEKEWISIHRQLQSSLQTAEGHVCRLSAELKSVEVALDAEREAAHQRSREVENLTSVNANIRACWERSKSDAQSKSNEVDQLNTECDRLRHRMNLHLSHVDELTHKEAALIQQTAALERHLEERNAALTGARSVSSDLRQQLDDATAQLHTTTQQWLVAKEQAEGLAARLADADGKVAKTMTSHQHDVTEMASVERRLKSDLAALQATVVELRKARIEDAGRYGNEVASLNEQILALQRDIKTLSDSLTESQNAFAQLQHSKLEAEQYVVELQTVLQHRDDECATLSTKHNEAATRALQHAADMEQLREALRAESSKLVQMQHECRQSHDTLADLRATICALTAERVALAAASEKAMDSLRTELRAALQDGDAREKIALDLLAAVKSSMVCEAQVAAKDNEISALQERAAISQKLHDAAMQAVEDRCSREHDELRLKFNLERDAVVVLKQRLTSEERTHSAVMAQVKRHESDVVHLQAQLLEKTKEIDTIRSRKDECKGAFLRLREVFIPLREHAQEAERENDRLLKEHYNLVRGANRQYRQLRDHVMQTRDRLATMFLSAHSSTLDAPHVAADVRELVMSLEAVLVATKPSVDPLQPSAGARKGLSNAPLNSQAIPPSHRLKREREP